MKQDPKPTMPGTLAAALTAALKKGATTKPVEHAAPKPLQQPKEQK